MDESEPLQRLCAEGEAFVRCGNLLKATKAYIQASKAAPSSDIFNKLCSVLLSLNKFKQAKDAAEKALGLQADNVLSHCLLGAAFLGLKQQDAAIVAFEQALQFDPGCNEARKQIEQVVGPPEAAESTFECLCGYPASSHDSLMQHLSHPNNQSREQHREKTAEDLQLSKQQAEEADTQRQVAIERAAVRREAGVRISAKLRQQFEQLTEVRAQRLEQLHVLAHFVDVDLIDCHWQGLGLPRLIVLVGAQGSGKSTLCQGLQARGWLKVNDSTAQESQKLRKQRLPIQLVFEDLLKEGLRSGRRVVVDRSNCELKQRAKWVHLAGEEGVEASEVAFAVLETPLSICQERVKLRQGHHLTEKHINVVETWHTALMKAFPTTNKEGVGGVFSLAPAQVVAFLDLMDLVEFPSSAKETEFQ